MIPYEIRFTKEAKKDVDQLSPQLKTKLKQLLINTITVDPYSSKHLVGNLKGFYSVWLTFKDRIVYSVDEKNRYIFIHRAKTHYGE